MKQRPAQTPTIETQRDDDPTQERQAPCMEWQSAKQSSPRTCLVEISTPYRGCPLNNDTDSFNRRGLAIDMSIEDPSHTLHPGHLRSPLQCYGVLCVTLSKSLAFSFVILFFVYGNN
ncbi:hypothetical protein J6590_035024 [Homalodisca vitripennis]|nr:hypothetical protein J6590_035024 [Homalodisca vitripennis]